MARPKKQANEQATGIIINLPKYDTVAVSIVGQTPFLCNRQSEKVKRGLLHPASAARRRQALKHNPIEEFRASPYVATDPTAPTLIEFLASAFKKSMMTAALDVPGAKKAQIGRLVRVEGERVPLWGVPKLSMMTVREAGMTRAPDVRSRAIIPQWTTDLTITFPSSLISYQSVLNLLSIAGIFSGVGDGRTEKGALNFGSFRVTNADDPEAIAIKVEGGREAQLAALEEPDCYDMETEALYEWFRTNVLNEVTA